jgi:hypothetical protein
MRELGEVQLAQRVELRGAQVGEPEPHDAAVVGVRDALDQAGVLGAIHEGDGAVVTEQQVAGGLADRRPALVVMAADGQEQLVLGGRDARRLGLLLAPAQEPPQAGAQLYRSSGLSSAA